MRKLIAFALAALLSAASWAETSSGTLSADGNTDAVSIVNPGVILVGGTFGGGTITLQVQGENGTWYSTSTTFNSADSDNIRFFKPTTVRLNLNGATSPSIYWEIRH